MTLCDFRLHPRLAADTVFVADLALSRLLRMNDRRYPWAILVPRRSGLREIADLAAAWQAELMREIDLVSRLLLHLHPDSKLNIAALGNVVAQLHIHVIARHAGDAAWPDPVWNRGVALPFAEAAIADGIAQWRQALFATSGRRYDE